MTMKKTCLTMAGAAFLAFSAGAMADGNNGNRYELDRAYNSEISSAETYGLMMQNKVTVIDVRRLREYAAGHPERAYNVPFPNIVYSGDQDPSVFYWEVYHIVQGRTDTPIATLCRTGFRSVLAANILAEPQANGVPNGIPFTNVRNIWEGFVGRELFAFGDIGPDPSLPRDLNNNGVIDSDTADVYDHSADANPDKNGWRNFQGLPWTTHIRKPLAYQQNKNQYSCWQTDAGC